MIDVTALKQISPYLYEIPKTYHQDMRLPARFYTDPDLLESALDDKSLDQLVNTATLPGVYNSHRKILKMGGLSS